MFAPGNRVMVLTCAIEGRCLTEHSVKAPRRAGYMAAPVSILVGPSLPRRASTPLSSCVPACAWIAAVAAHGTRGVVKQCATLGGQAPPERNHLQRVWRGIDASSLHAILTHRTNLEMYGRILLGLPQNSPLI